MLSPSPKYTLFSKGTHNCLMESLIISFPVHCILSQDPFWKCQVRSLGQEISMIWLWCHKLKHVMQLWPISAVYRKQVCRWCQTDIDPTWKRLSSWCPALALMSSRNPTNTPVLWLLSAAAMSATTPSNAHRTVGPQKVQLHHYSTNFG